jgi:hypothetical protein
MRPSWRLYRHMFLSASDRFVQPSYIAMVFCLAWLSELPVLLVYPLLLLGSYVQLGSKGLRAAT